MGVSIRPSDAVKGGGLEPGRYKYSNSHYARYTYPNSTLETLALVADLEDVEGQVREQAWSIGSLEDFIPSDDGQELVQIGRRERLSDSCNLIMFNASLVRAGYPEDRMSERAGETYDGLEILLVPQEHKRTGKQREGMSPTVTVAECEEIFAFPWGASAGASSGGGAASSNGHGTGDINDDLRNYLGEIVPAGGMTLPSARTKVYQWVKDRPAGDKDEATKLMGDEAFLASLEEVGIARDENKLLKVG